MSNVKFHSLKEKHFFVFFLQTFLLPITHAFCTHLTFGKQRNTKTEVLLKKKMVIKPQFCCFYFFCILTSYYYYYYYYFVLYSVSFLRLSFTKGFEWRMCWSDLTNKLNILQELCDAFAYVYNRKIFLKYLTLVCKKNLARYLI